jgi:hypothetical protein
MNEENENIIKNSYRLNYEEINICYIKHLYILINAITKINKIIKKINIISKLKSLYMNVNKFSYNEIIKFCKKIKMENIIRLNIGSNNLTDDSLNELLNLVKSCKKLISLDLGTYKSTKFFKEKENKFKNKDKIYEIAKTIYEKSQKTNEKNNHYIGFQNSYIENNIEELCNKLDKLKINYIGIQKNKKGKKNIFESTKKISFKDPNELIYIQSIYRNNM